jgi:calcineurin-like phosphoesterase family protein
VREIWLISDTHFQHSNMLKWGCSRAKRFSSSDEWDELIVENWNAQVKPGDIVYHLGDVFFGDKDKFRKLWARLPGRKRLIAGNHDDIKWLARQELFQKILISRVFKDRGVCLSHIPLHPDHSWGLRNVHGHIHDNPSPTPRHHCVCVEQTDYQLVNLDDVCTAN